MSNNFADLSREFITVYDSEDSPFVVSRINANELVKYSGFRFTVEKPEAVEEVSIEEFIELETIEEAASEETDEENFEDSGSENSTKSLEEESVEFAGIEDIRSYLLTTFTASALRLKLEKEFDVKPAGRLSHEKLADLYIEKREETKGA